MNFNPLIWKLKNLQKSKTLKDNYLTVNGITAKIKSLILLFLVSSFFSFFIETFNIFEQILLGLSTLVLLISTPFLFLLKPSNKKGFTYFYTVLFGIVTGEFFYLSYSNDNIILMLYISSIVILINLINTYRYKRINIKNSVQVGLLAFLSGMATIILLNIILPLLDFQYSIPMYRSENIFVSIILLIWITTSIYFDVFELFDKDNLQKIPNSFENYAALSIFFSIFFQFINFLHIFILLFSFAKLCWNSGFYISKKIYYYVSKI